MQPRYIVGDSHGNDTMEGAPLEKLTKKKVNELQKKKKIWMEKEIFEDPLPLYKWFIQKFMIPENETEQETILYWTSSVDVVKLHKNNAKEKKIQCVLRGLRLKNNNAHFNIRVS